MPADDPLWYKDAIIYELHVRAFHDSVGDGYGDFRGLTRKLDYLEDLGVTAVWLLPFYPSPLKDDGYDIADYTAVNPQYGTLDDFQEFLAEAHRRDIRVITELVVNHTSDQHPWFQRARRSPPGSVERDFYVWSDTPERYKDARVIFKDFEPSNWSWDPVAKAYYWHRFYSHQPDLNFDNPAVRDALTPVLDFWLGMGVDGMRLDAIPYLFEREGTNCENLPETHQFLKYLRRHMDDRFPGRMFLAEANQWPEDAVAYFGGGDECHMAFHFPLMPRLFMALHQEDRFPILDILDQTPAIPDNCQWCLFLRNHDELTLEMVTDEERDYMYRAYAQDRTARINLGIRHRLAPLLRNDRRRIELMNALLFSMPGTPVVYYGDEIGMGDNIYLGDRNGVRTPMQWSSDRNAGFSRANPQKLYLPVIIDPEYHYEAVNVEAQQNNPSSLLWWMKRLIALRKRYKAFGRGTIEFLRPANPKVLAFVRRYRDEQVLVVANLSRFVQHVELDLPGYAGSVPEELFGRSLFPPVGEGPYPLTLGPHGFYWFALTPPKPTVVVVSEDAAVDPLRILRVGRHWGELADGPGRDELEQILPQFFQRRRPGAVVAGCRVLESWPLAPKGLDVRLTVVRVESRSGLPEVVFLPLTFVPDDETGQLIAPVAEVGVARVERPQPGVVCDALAVPDYCRALAELIATGRRFPVGAGEVVAVTLPGAETAVAPEPGEGPPQYRRSDRGNLSITFGTRAILKTFRRVEEGTNPDLEVGRFLTARQQYSGAAPLLGYVEYRRPGGEAATVAVLHRYVENQGDAWQYTLDQLSQFFERVAALSREDPPAPPAPAPLLGPDGSDPADEFEGLVGGYLETARQLGRLTAELHKALSADPLDPAFAPEQFSKAYQRSVYQTMRTIAGQVCGRLAREGTRYPEPLRDLANRVVADHDRMLARFRGLLDRPVGGMRIRCHGDYHLGQLLYTGRDFVVIDFEGEPGRAVGERKIKRSPLRDVAAMIRSLDYVVGIALDGRGNGRGRLSGVIRPEDRATLATWAAAWFNRVTRAFVTSYLDAVAPAGLLPESDDDKRTLLEMYLLEKALQEADHDLTVRPKWAHIPLRGVLRLMGG
jgi:maltose alpha-D-glucosyltransferase/alpha-amylase